MKIHKISKILDATGRLGLPACLEFPGGPGDHGGLGNIQRCISCYADICSFRSRLCGILSLIPEGHLGEPSGAQGSFLLQTLVYLPWPRPRVSPRMFSAGENTSALINRAPPMPPTPQVENRDFSTYSNNF